MAKKKKSVADDIINGEYKDIWTQAKEKQTSNNNQSSNYNLPTKEKVTNVLKNAAKEETKGLLPYVFKNYKQGLTEGTAGIVQGQILNSANEAKKISEKNSKEKLKDLTQNLAEILNPVYGITKKSYEIGQNTLNTLKDKDKNVKQKVADILTNTASGVKDMNNPIGDVVKLSGKTAGLINKDSGNKLLEINEKIEKPLRESREKLQEEGQDYSNAVRMAGTVSNVVGNMTPSIVASRLGGGNEALSQALSLGTMGLSVKGRATQEALSKGAELDKAIKIGDTKAMTEVGTELLTGGLNIFGKGALDNIVERGINKKVTNKVLNYLAKQGAGIAGEVGEETISDILNTVIDQGTVDHNATYSMKDWSDTALTTMLSTVVLNALGGAYTPRAYNQNVQEMEQFKAKQDITERINNSNLSEEDKSNMLNYVQNEDFTQADYNAMRERIDIANNQETLYNNNESEGDIYDATRDNNQYNETKEIRENQSVLPENASTYTGNEITNELYEQNRKEVEDTIKGEIKNNFGFNDDVSNNIYKKISQKDNLTREDIYNAFDNYRDIILEDVSDDVKQAVNDIKRTLRTIKIDTSNIKGDIADYKDFYRRNFNRVSMGNDGIGIDVLYKELLSTYPGYFDENIINPTDQLQQIVAWRDFDADELLKPSTYTLTDSDLEPIADTILGYREYLNNIKPKNSNQSSFIMPTAENTEINPYRNTGRANKLIKEKNTKIEQLENKLKQTTSQEEQNNIQQEIQNIEKQYNEQIQTLYDEINNKDNKERKAPTRHEVIQKNREIARQNIDNIANWNDKKSGIRYQLETMERNMYDIIPDKLEAKRMNETYFEPIHTAEAEKQKFINQYNDRIKEFNLNKYEAEAVQVLGEQKYNPSFDAKEAEKALENVKKNIDKGKIDQEKVNNAIEEFRNIYDELFDLENKVLKDNGYKEKDYRKGYFPHFIDYVPETISEKILNKLGFKIDKRPLPTDIAGITEQFVPGKTWNRSALQRKTNKTDYNALKGFDTYIAQASDNIFHTENIQRLRGLENEIRYQYSDKGVQKRIDEILNNDILDADEKQDMIDAILKQVENPMPNLVTELRRYTNALANKKSEADRSIEQMAGRQVYSTINAIENKFGANAVGLNIGSAVTNFIPITQAWSQVKTKNMTRAIFDTVKSYANNDGFVDKSAFLTSRLNQSEKLYQTWSDKATNKANFLFDAIDEVASNIVVRGKYLENIEKGMTETEAIKDADQFARNVIADRSKGALPTKFEEKNPISKALTQFQLEVNNQYRYMFKDIPRDLAEKGLGSIALAYLKMFIGAWLYNKVAEKSTGRKPAFSPIDLVKSSYETLIDKDMGTYEKITSIGKEVGEQLPFVGGFLGGGRVPINGALPNIANVTKAGIGLVTGEMDSKKAKETLGKEFSKPLYYLLPPLGGGQLKKSVEGISTVKNGGSYGVDKEGKETLQFPVENKNALNYIKAGVFGKYALPEAKTYTESGYKSLNAKQTEAYKDIKLPYKEFIEYANNKLENTSDKINYINNMKINDDQKWGLYKYDVFSSNERDDGTSQKSDAEYAINNKLATKKEYMNLYNSASKNNISMPNTEELKKLKEQGITLKTYVDYKINTKGKKKQSDKIQALIDSNYTDNDKSKIYSNYINKEDDNYKYIESTGININKYLNYKLQNFESDRKNDGTLQGESKRNKKDKVVKYLNSMDITGSQRLLLYAMQGYKTDNKQKNQLVKYVKSLDLDNKGKLELFNKFSGFKVYKNGKITY